VRDEKAERKENNNEHETDRHKDDPNNHRRDITRPEAKAWRRLAFPRQRLTRVQLANDLWVHPGIVCCRLRATTRRLSASRYAGQMWPERSRVAGSPTRRRRSCGSPSRVFLV
jgi:hypothetical protein